MKTAMKITAIAVITVLAVLSCAPEAELTSRDWSEYREQYSDEYTNNVNSATGITVSANLSASATALPYRREITVTFPNTADVLKESNANIAARMKEFLNFYTYTNVVSPTTYTPSALGTTALDYEFIERINSTSSTNVVIRLASVPDVRRIVAKLDASKYKRRGQLTDNNGDGIAGEIYDDRYFPLSVSDYSGSAPADPGPNYNDPAVTLTLDITDISSTGYLTYTPEPLQTRYISIATIGDVPDSATVERTILGDLKDNFVLEKYNKTSKTWEKDAAAIRVNNSSDPSVTSVTGIFTDCLFVTISSYEDLGIYRLKATGMKNLATKSNIGTVPAKIIVSGATSLTDTVYKNPVVISKNTRTQIYSQSDFIGPYDVNVSSDASKKNVVIEVPLSSINVMVSGTPTDAYPSAITKDDIKLVYARDGGSLRDTNMVEIGISSVELQVSKFYDLTATKNNLLVIKLNPDYQLQGNREVNLFLSPGFKYSVDTITFGNITGPNFQFGSFFWRNYGVIADL